MVNIHEIDTEILADPLPTAASEPASREDLRELVRELLREELERARRLEARS